jgi:hypothetical protein
MNLPCVVKSYLSAPRLDNYSLLLMLSVIVAVVVTPLLLYLYRRRVIQLMGDVLQPGISAPIPVEHPLSDELGPSGVAAVPLDGSGDPTKNLETAGRLRRRQLTLALIKTVLVLAATMAATSLTLEWLTGGPIRVAAARSPLWVTAVILLPLWFSITILFCSCISWPIVLLGTATPRFGRWFVLLTVPWFLLGAVIAITSRGLNPRVRDTGLFILLLCVGVCIRQMRNAVPTLALALFILILPLVELSTFIGTIRSCSGELLSRPTLLALVLLALCLGGWSAYRTLGAVASAYRNKRFSDAQLQMLLWFVLLVMPLVTNGAFRGIAGATASPFLALAGVVVLIPALFAYRRFLYRLPAPHFPPVTLLLLRVFGPSRDQERQLDRLASYWRFIGPICMIGGPDLAKAQVQPQKIAAFLSRKLRGTFINDGASLARCMEEVDLKPDPDTRYRVNEFFCTGEIWVAAARQLMRRCDVVLIDLRRFQRGRFGTATELEMLSHLGALDKSILIVGKGTDMDAMREAVGRGATRQLPPLHVLEDVKTFRADEFFAKIVQGCG